MFIHNFKYTLKILFRNRTLIFWTFAFPLILGTFFDMAFSDINENEKLDIINIAIIDNDEFRNNETFKTAFENLSDKDNEDRLFESKYTTEENAKKLLENDEVVGYLKLVNNEPKLVFNTSGIDQTILKYVTEEISQTKSMIENLSEEEIKKEIMLGKTSPDYENIYNKVTEMINSTEVELNNISNKNLDYVMIEFYTLIAMTCLYGGILGMVAINQNLANMGSVGKRVSIAPTKKWTTILSSVLASYLTQLIGLTILFLYTIFIIKVNYGNNIFSVALLASIGSLAGLSMGVFIGTTFKTNENTKTGVLLAITMLGCFLSGMMGITMKYIIDKDIPIINKLNPASMITDGFYSLYYYNTLNRYWFNIISLLIFTFILIFLSIISLRRQKYDNI